MTRCAAILVSLLLTGCGPTWPAKEVPNSIRVKRTLFASGSDSFSISNCEAMVVELADGWPLPHFGRFAKVQDKLVFERPAGWAATPVMTGAHKSYYEGAINGCGEGVPLGDFGGALRRPGSFYKVLNGGEGVIILNPAAKLAGYFYFG